jgi:phage gp29-like protein
MSKNPLKQKMRTIDSARQMYNTLRQLTIQRAVNLLEEGERGIYTRLAWTTRKIEKRWSVMIGLKANREGALLDMDWDIRTVPEDRLPPGMTQADADRQAVALRSAYEQIENLRAAIKFLHLASFRGFAHLEKINAAGMATIRPDEIKRLEPLWQWHLIRDGMTGPWLFDEKLTGSLTGATEIDPQTVLVREVEDPLCEVALVAYVYEMLGRKDWAGFVEVFGIPDLFFVMPPGTTTDDLTIWQNVVESMFGDGKGLLPNGSSIETAGGDVRGSSPFKEFVKFQREDVVLAGTGGQLTMLAESGTGTLAGGAHADVFERIAQREAREISEVFQQAIDLPLLKEKFPNQPTLAWFEIAAEDVEDTKDVVNNIAALAQAGYVTEPDQVQEKTGLRVTFVPCAEDGGRRTEDGGLRTEVSNRSVLKPWTWFGNRRPLSNRQTEAEKVQETLLQNARNALAEAVEADLIEVYDRLAQIIDDTPDDDLVAAIEKFQTEELPELAAAALADPAAADVIADTLSAGLLNGVAAATEERGRKPEDGRRKTEDGGQK